MILRRQRCFLPSESTPPSFLDTSLEGSVYPGRVTSICAIYAGKTKVVDRSVNFKAFSNPVTHQRWPAIRPDDVVPMLSFKRIVQDSKEKEDLSTALTTRTGWKRGLRDTGETSPNFMYSALVLTLYDCSFILIFPVGFPWERRHG